MRRGRRYRCGVLPPCGAWAGRDASGEPIERTFPGQIRVNQACRSHGVISKTGPQGGKDPGAGLEVSASDRKKLLLYSRGLGSFRANLDILYGRSEAAGGQAKQNEALQQRRLERRHGRTNEVSGDLPVLSTKGKAEPRDHLTLRFRALYLECQHLIHMEHQQVEVSGGGVQVARVGRGLRCHAGLNWQRVIREDCLAHPPCFSAEPPNNFRFRQSHEPLYRVNLELVQRASGFR